MNITVWEWEKPAAVVETYWQVQQQGLTLTKNDSQTKKSNKSSSDEAPSMMLDPFGLVTWPGSVVAVQELLLLQHQKPTTFDKIFFNKTVLVLGAGVGVEAQAAARLGAARVLATDVHPTTLQLLHYGAVQAGWAGVEETSTTIHSNSSSSSTTLPPKKNIITTQLLDLFLPDEHPLPDNVDFILVADVLYNDQLADQVIQRCLEARRRSHHPPPVILISDSQRFVHTFESKMNDGLKSLATHPSNKTTDSDDKANTLAPQYARVAWTSRRLPQFTGSGVCIDADQTYDVKARVMWIGLDNT
jgi:predicted nicotinamide N-methyase